MAFASRAFRTASRWLVPALAAAAPVAAQADVIIRGRVAERATDLAVPFAEVVLVGVKLATPRIVVADSGGVFVFAVPVARRYSLLARRIGYDPAMATFDSADIAGGTELRLRRRPASLDTVTTVGPRERQIYMDGFEYRKHLGIGIFLTRDQLIAKGTPSLAELMHYIPPAGGFSGVNNDVMSVRAVSCSPLVFMDGVKLNGSGDATTEYHRMFDGRTFEAVEIYKGHTQLPGEFGGYDAKCGAVVVWTRTAR
ncbi:MAG: hypothetical protein ABJD07_03830 [Gemmatimonadaceae bacterium]